jgi:hypothetical protein
MHNPAEWLLDRLTDPDRAAAILGDLEEMAQTRGRPWFWIAYTRTLVTLGWRAPVAIVAGVVTAKYLRKALAELLMSLTWRSAVIQTNDPRLLAGLHPHIAHFSWTVSLSAVFTLWILLPYIAIRFGVRNRLTYLAGTLFLFAVPVYTLRPQVYQLTGFICALIIVAALASPLWRRQMIFLAANYPVAILAYYVCITDPLGIFHPHHHLYAMSLFRMRIDDPVAIAITVIIGPPLYRWLLQPRPTGGAHAQPA